MAQGDPDLAVELQKALVALDWELLGRVSGRLREGQSYNPRKVSRNSRSSKEFYKMKPLWGKLGKTLTKANPEFRM